jgi:hypothetical protein
MAGEVAASELSAVATSTTYVPERNPFQVYLARLGKGSRPTMADALERIARIASGGTLEAAAFPWHLLRYQHVTAVRTALMECISERTQKPLGPATVNKALSALRGVLREAWRLGLMSAEDLARATDFAPVRGSTVLRGRALASHCTAPRSERVIVPDWRRRSAFRSVWHWGCRERNAERSGFRWGKLTGWAVRAATLGQSGGGLRFLRARGASGRGVGC